MYRHWTCDTGIEHGLPQTKVGCLDFPIRNICDISCVMTQFLVTKVIYNTTQCITLIWFTVLYYISVKLVSTDEKNRQVKWCNIWWWWWGRRTHERTLFWFDQLRPMLTALSTNANLKWKKQRQ